MKGDEKMTAIAKKSALNANKSDVCTACSTDDNNRAAMSDESPSCISRILHLI